MFLVTALILFILSTIVTVSPQSDSSSFVSPSSHYLAVRNVTKTDHREETFLHQFILSNICAESWCESVEMRFKLVEISENQLLNLLKIVCSSSEVTTRHTL